VCNAAVCVYHPRPDATHVTTHRIGGRRRRQADLDQGELAEDFLLGRGISNFRFPSVNNSDNIRTAPRSTATFSECDDALIHRSADWVPAVYLSAAAGC